MRKLKISMIVFNNVIDDPRVRKEAEALAEWGGEVLVFGIQDSSKAMSPSGYQVDRIFLRSSFRKRGRIFFLLRYIEFFLRVLKRGRNFGAQVVHAHDLDTLFLGWVLAKISKARLIYDAHELFSEQHGERRLIDLFWRWMEKVLIHRADRVISVNESIARILQEEKGAVTAEVVMNCQPLNERKFFQKDQRKVGRILLFQGHLLPDRGLENLIRSLQFLKSSVCLYVAGDGPLRRDLEKLATSEGVFHLVKFKGTIPYNELSNLTLKADLGVIPYRNTCRNNYYSLPNKLFEYLVAKIPVAVSDFPELRKIVGGYSVGSLFNPEDPRSIAEAINFIIEDNIRYEQMKRNIEKVVEVYNWDNEKMKLLKIYENLIGSY